MPTFRIGARGIDGCIAAACAAAETKQFRIDNREARLARKAGDVSAVFPFGTYGEVMHHNAPVHTQPRDTAFVAKPGPLLADVMRECEQLRSSHERQAAREGSIAMSDDAHLALVEEAAALVADDEMTFDTLGRGSEGDKATATVGERARAVVQHRFGRIKNNPDTAPSRVITLRDARRGRPSNKHGADPPG